MKSELIAIKDLKKGDKFYYYDNLIYKLLSLTIVHGNNDRVDLVLERFKTKEVINMSINGTSSALHNVYKYTGRDSSSFFAGFRAAIRICEKHMQQFDKENAGIEDDLSAFLLSREEYKKWKQNNFNDE